MTAIAGLEGIVVAETTLSAVEGEAGRLIVRGHSIDDLAGHVSFEDMIRLLWEGLVPLPTAAPAGEPSILTAALGRARVAVFETLTGGNRKMELAAIAAALPPMAALRLGIASLPPGAAGGVPGAEVATGTGAGAGVVSGAEVRATGTGANGDGDGDAILATAAMPVLVAAFDRARRGLPPVAPDPRLGQAADFLAMLRGQPASAGEAAALDAYLVTVAEHGMNASTFTARVVASTAAGVLPSVVAALAALEGPLHGGAPGPVLDMLDALASHPDRRAWLRAEIAAGRRLMGFGHRIYRVRDPRADVLKAQVERLRAAGGAAAGDRLALAEQVERDALAVLAERHPDRRLDTNVEFATAVLLDALGIDRTLFTSIFAIGRVAGWCAHIHEQQRSRRLIRPQSAYIGPRPPAVVPPPPAPPA